jgi:hypothetical protein
MSRVIYVSTRKGLFRVVKGARWSIERAWFVGDNVSLSTRDPRDGALYAAMNLGHFGVKLRRSVDDGARWDEVAAPAFPKQPEGSEDRTPDGKPWPWRVEQVWALEPGAASQPGVLWCGTIPGGLFRSNDCGASWELVRSLWDMPERKQWFGGGADLPGIHSVAVHPGDGDDVVVGVSCGGAWRTRDGGATWSVASRGMRAAFMPPDRADDPVIQDPHRIAQCRAAPDRLVTQHHNGVFVSDDRGGSWRELTDAAPSAFGFAVAAHPRDPGTFWLVPAQKDEHRVPVDARVVVSRTRDRGASWDVLTDGLPQEHAYDLVYRHALDVGDDGALLAFGSTTGSLWVSEDAGDAWTCVSTHLPPIYAVHVAS